MNRAVLFIRDLEALTEERAVFPERVEPLLERAREEAQWRPSWEGHIIALAAAYALSRDPVFAGGDEELAWAIRASFTHIPPTGLIDRIIRIFEEEVRRYEGQYDRFGRPAPEWERYQDALNRALRLRRQAEGEDAYAGIVEFHRDLDEVIDALIKLLVEEESREKRDNIAGIVGALRLNLK